MRQTILYIVFCLSCFIADAQEIKLIDASSFNVVNRQLSITKKEAKTQVYLNAAEGDGIAWIKQINFSNGTIEFDVKGKDVLQQSFVGIAFHGLNDSTFEGIYFRPFNFNAADTNRKNHSVQYISLPKYDWEYLRNNYPGVYEHALTSKVEATAWFHVRIEVSKDLIRTFINDDKQPCLTVKPISSVAGKQIGFWVGNNSDGDFANLVLSEKH